MWSFLCMSALWANGSLLHYHNTSLPQHFTWSMILSWWYLESSHSCSRKALILSYLGLITHNIVVLGDLQQYLFIILYFGTLQEFPLLDPDCGCDHRHHGLSRPISWGWHWALDVSLVKRSRFWLADISPKQSRPIHLDGQKTHCGWLYGWGSSDISTSTSWD